MFVALLFFESSCLCCVSVCHDMVGGGAGRSLIEGGQHVIHNAKRAEKDIPEPVEVPDFAHVLPREIQK